MRLKLILPPLVLLICLSFANANDKTASNKEVQALDVADKDDNLIPAADQKYDRHDNKEFGNDESDADDQPAAEEDEPENFSTELEDQSYDAVDAADKKQSDGMADPKPYYRRRFYRRRVLRRRQNFRRRYYRRRFYRRRVLRRRQNFRRRYYRRRFYRRRVLRRRRNFRRRYYRRRSYRRRYYRRRFYRRRG